MISKRPLTGLIGLGFVVAFIGGVSLGRAAAPDDQASGYPYEVGRQHETSKAPVRVSRWRDPTNGRGFVIFESDAGIYAAPDQIHSNALAGCVPRF